MENAIKKSIEGGYQSKFVSEIKKKNLVIHIEKQEWKYPSDYEVSVGSKVNWEFVSTLGMILLDPIFWQALGKAEGWGKINMYSYITGVLYKEEDWILQMHRFIDHLAEGRPIDDFFNSLLK